MSGLDLDAIEKRAGLATGERWEAFSQRDPGTPWRRRIGILDREVEDLEDVVIISGFDVSEADAKHIAGMDPETTLALVAELRRYRSITLDDLARAWIEGGRFPMAWGQLTAQEQHWAREDIRGVLELLRGPAPEPSADELATIARFGLDKPQGPAEFDFTPGGGDAA